MFLTTTKLIEKLNKYAKKGLGVVNIIKLDVINLGNNHLYIILERDIKNN